MEKNSCSVTLTYNDITIQRTKRPNRLVYTKQNEIYEDNEAQIYINEYFGNQPHNNFLESSSLDKTEYLEKMAFGKSTEIIELMKENTKKIFDPLMMKQIIQKDNYLLRKNYLSRLSMTGIIVCVQ